MSVEQSHLNERGALWSNISGKLRTQSKRVCRWPGDDLCVCVWLCVCICKPVGIRKWKRLLVKSVHVCQCINESEDSKYKHSTGAMKGSQ